MPSREEYPWLEQALAEVFAGNAAQASENWRRRLEPLEYTTLQYQVRSDGTATVWCGQTRHDFGREPKSKKLLDGLDDAYRRELKRLER
jgi:hypothetical protein